METGVEGDTDSSGNMVREEHGIEMLGGMSGKRKQGRPRTRWLDTLINLKQRSVNIMNQK